MGTGGCFPGVKRQEREPDHRPPSSIEVRNGEAIPPLICFDGIVLNYIIKYNFTSFYVFTNMCFKLESSDCSACVYYTSYNALFKEDEVGRACSTNGGEEDCI
jgi:hypothetical protein